MINFTNDGLLITISYLIPGFLINILIVNALHLENTNNTILLFKFLVFSLLNMAVYTIIDEVFLFFLPDYSIKNEVFISVMRNFILPIILAMCLILLIQYIENIRQLDSEDQVKGYKKWKERLLFYFINIVYWLGFDKASLTSSSWDYLFYELKQIGGAYIIIELKNGNLIYGLFDSRSFVSSQRSLGENDLFLEETYQDSSFSIANNSSVYIHQSDIYTIGIDSCRIKNDEININESEVHDIEKRRGYKQRYTARTKW